MVSPVLAQAILNQQAPDILGRFDQGRAEARSSKARTLAGQALQQGGGSALEELKGIDPEVALTIGQSINAQSANDINEFVRDAKIGESMLKSGNVNGFIDFAQQRSNILRNQGRDTQQTDRILELARRGQANQALEELSAFSSAVTQGKQAPLQKTKSVLIKDPETGEITQVTNLMNPNTGDITTKETKIQGGQLVSELGETPEEQTKRRVEERKQGAEAVSEVKLTEAENLNDILRRRKKGEALGANEATTLKSAIDKGLEAISSLSNVKRGLELLKTVKTGGISAINKRVTDFFGTTSGDVGELNNILGKNVLAGLSAFTGQISDGERKFLERMETSISQGKAANIAQLTRAQGILEREIKKGRRAAEISESQFELELFDQQGQPEGFGVQQDVQQDDQPQQVFEVNF